jgi:hypothetical protein
VLVSGVATYINSTVNPTVTITGNATVAQVTTVNAQNGSGSVTYNLADTAANLIAAGSNFVGAAGAVTVSGTVTLANLATIDGFTTPPLSYSVISGTAEALLADTLYVTSATRLVIDGALSSEQRANLITKVGANVELTYATEVSITSITPNTGADTSDNITSVADGGTLVVAGALTAPLVSGQILQITTDNGSNWTTVLNNQTSTTWSYNYTVVGTGSTPTFQVRVLTGDTPGSTASRTITIDSLAPNAPATLDLATGDDTGANNSDNITKQTTGLTITGAGENGSVVQLYRWVDAGATPDNAVQDSELTATGATAVVSSGGTFSIDLALTSGTYKIVAKQTDAAGNVSVASSALNIEIDTTNPSAPTSINLVSAGDLGTSNSDNLTAQMTGLSFTAVIESSTATAVFFNDADNDGVMDSGEELLGSVSVSGTTATWTGASLAEGVHNIKAIQTDAAGNDSVASAGLTVTVDDTPPAASVSITGILQDTNLPGDFVTSDTTLTLQGILSQALAAGDKVQVSTNGGTSWVDATVDNAALTWSLVDSTVYTHGNFTYTVRVIDEAGCW